MLLSHVVVQYPLTCYASEPCGGSHPYISCLLSFLDNLYNYSLFLNQMIFYLLVSFHFYCPRLFVVVYKDVILYIASEVMVGDTCVSRLIVIGTAINQLETNVLLK